MSELATSRVPRQQSNVSWNPGAQRASSSHGHPRCWPATRGTAPRMRRWNTSNELAVDVLSIIIVSYNARTHLQDCLESLTTSPPSTPHEIIVVDNASPDDSVAMVRSRWPDVTV